MPGQATGEESWHREAVEMDVLHVGKVRGIKVWNGIPSPKAIEAFFQKPKREVNKERFQ